LIEDLMMMMMYDVMIWFRLMVVEMVVMERAQRAQRARPPLPISLCGIGRSLGIPIRMGR
jgi:Na+-transporting NADH:ubiquinone oxidoreductase subunit NqrD